MLFLFCIDVRQQTTAEQIALRANHGTKPIIAHTQLQKARDSTILAKSIQTGSRKISLLDVSHIERQNPRKIQMASDRRSRYEADHSS